jgi:hypothetical protein
MSNTPNRLDKTEARQGKSGLGVRYVLIAGLVLVIVAFAVVWMLTRTTTPA